MRVEHNHIIKILLSLYVSQKIAGVSENDFKIMKKIFSNILPYLLSSVFILLIMDKALSFYRTGFGFERHILLREFNPNTDKKSLKLQGEDIDNKTAPPQKYRHRTDANGFLIPSQIHQNPDLTLAFLGGSTTECSHVEEELRFPYLVGHLLEKKKSIKINSINSGVSSGHSLHSLNILLNKIVPIKPQYAIMMETINDLAMLHYAKSYWAENKTKGIIVDNSLAKQGFIRKIFPNLTRIFELLLVRINRPPDEWVEYRTPDLEYDEPLVLAAFEQNLQAFVNLCRAYKITPILMTQFNRYKDKPSDWVYKHWNNRHPSEATLTETEQKKEYTQFLSLYRKMNDKIREIGKVNEVLVIELDRVVPQEKSHIYDCIHLNDTGSKLVAEHIAKVFSEKVLSEGKIISDK